jgi:hypothetical protein
MVDPVPSGADTLGFLVCVAIIHVDAYAHPAWRRDLSRSRRTRPPDICEVAQRKRAATT